MLTIYKGLVRPCMEYASHIWGPRMTGQTPISREPAHEGQNSGLELEYDEYDHFGELLFFETRLTRLS